MSDLISRKVFKQQVSAMAIRENLDIDKVGAMLKLIDAQPTAYDVDKVVERIDNLFPLQTTAGTFVSEEDVIRLVKGGVADE